LNKVLSNKVVFYALIILGATACSVQKNTGLSRAYHNVTAKYNILFNGNESFKKGLKNIETNFRDDYSEILPIFIYSKKDAVANGNSDMDRTIKKCSKLISLHSITVKPKVKDNKNLSPKQREFFNKKEYNLFVDDSYLLMGKAHFYKQEFDMASEVFWLILNDFKNQPVTYETQIWFARLYIETNQFKSAYEILNLLENNDSFPKHLLSMLFPTFADYYLRQKDYIHAINYLEKALIFESSKKARTRYLYILSQLYEKTGDLKKASDYYSRVIKMNPVYEMAFNARINRALAYQQGFGNVRDIEDELRKMLRDDKNIEYQDQIYYALGNLAAKEGNDTLALQNYKKSIQVNVDNQQQKVHSYLTIADLYYGIPDYKNAQAYYDSAVTNIGSDYPGYEALLTKSKNLTRLVEEINIVQFEDSVLLLAKLPQQELYKRIDEIIVNERKKEELERQRQQEEQLDQQYGNETAIRNFARQQNTTQGARWYFYNEAAKSLGYREFKLKFGNRKLEDHWQRSNKTAVVFAAGNEEVTEQDEAENSASENSYSKMSREYYLINIPKTDSAVFESNKRIEKALYNMGVIYKNDLKDYDKATISFKELIKRFPSSEYLLGSNFNLYTIAKDQNNQAMMDYYKDIIASQFPQSTYAKLLTNPNYLIELEEQEKNIKQYYELTYEFYKSGNYNEVISRSDFALKNFSNNPLIPQFAYLGLLAKGKNSDRKIFRDNLVALVAAYPSTEVALDAQNLIQYMDQEHPEFKEAEEVILSKKLYQKGFDTEHVFAFLVDKKLNTNQLVFNIINFNLDNFDKLNLKVDIIELNQLQKLVIVKSFPDKLKAMEYLNLISTSEAVYKDMPKVSLTPIAISIENLNTLKEDKVSERYLKFYNENYP
jgi:tetratricopeptide (TPR) repeat protein